MPKTPEKDLARWRAYYHANRDRLLARKRESWKVYITLHREQRLQQARAYREKYREQIKRKQREEWSPHYRATHAEELKARRRTPEHREKQRQRMASWRAANPEKNATAQERGRAKHRAAGRARMKARRQRMTPEDKAAYAAKRAAERRANLAKYRAKELAYDRTHPEMRREAHRRWRVRRLGAPVVDLTPAQWNEIKAAYDHRCVYCGRKMQRLTQDHITPISKGGHHTVSNVVPACRPCNSAKHIHAPLKPVQPLLLTLS
jgi:5-methylcytosine-specific restriction endonuclease McrA